MKIRDRKVIKETPFLSMIEIQYALKDGQTKKWYGVTRTNAKFAVVVAAVTKEGELIFVRQPRPMVGTYTIELPAGLADIKGETSLEIAERELIEETGFTAEGFKILVGGEKGLTISSGMTDERLILVTAHDARKVTTPLTNEATEPILIPLSSAFNWTMEMSLRGVEVDYKIFGTIRLIEQEMKS